MSRHWVYEVARRTVIRRWGNSAAIRIPASVLAAARLGADQAVEVIEEQGRVFIDPARNEPVCDLETLLAGITPENLHPEEETGPPRGREAW